MTEDPRVENLLAFYELLMRDLLPDTMALAVSQQDLAPARKEALAGYFETLLAIIDKGPACEEAETSRESTRKLLQMLPSEQRAMFSSVILNMFAAMDQRPPRWGHTP